MDKNDVINKIREYMGNAKNFITADASLSGDLVGMKIFEEPLVGFASADDSMFMELKKPEAIGPHFRAPGEWCINGKTVISFFLPFTDQIKIANSRDLNWPADEWLHGRIEGQSFLMDLCRFIVNELNCNGFEAIAPTIDEGFWARERANQGENPNIKYTSNWSERHVAFVCGLGTFGLSKGFITERGVAGRIGSVVTSLELAGDKRKYNDLYEYCTNCGACLKNCPVNAISFEKGKDHVPCGAFLNKTKIICTPRYGCGKCQVKVPCENQIPIRSKQDRKE